VAWGSTYWVAKELVSQDTVLAVLGVRMTMTAVALGLILVGMRKRLQKTEAVIGCVRDDPRTGNGRRQAGA
jgi:hypothetical protein